jgi:hypothetical protein
VEDASERRICGDQLRSACLCLLACLEVLLDDPALGSVGDQLHADDYGAIAVATFLTHRDRLLANAETRNAALSPG